VSNSTISPDKLAILNDTAQALMTELDLPVLLEKILASVKVIFAVDRCAILHLDSTGRRLNMLKSIGYAEDVAAEFSVPVGEGISGWVASVGMPAVVEDLANDPRYIPGVRGAVSEVAVPLKRHDEVVGVLDIESTTRLDMATFDMDLLTLFASHCAAALYNASLLQKVQSHEVQLEHRVRELQVLNHVGRLLGEVLSLDDVLQEILRLSREVLKFNICAVLLPDLDDPGTLQIRAAIGYPKDVVNGTRVARGEGITGTVFRTGIPKLVDDVTHHPDYIPGTASGRCEMACPLVARGKILGVLDAEGDEPGGFDDQQFVLFSTFASQAAVAIRNAQVMERKQAVYYQTISSLANALETRDEYTRGHSERVTRMAIQMGRVMGLEEVEMDIIRQAGILHDIGKIGIADGVLNKPSTLSSEERGEIEHHPLFGNHILGQLKFLKNASKAILHHHERFDGGGYPSGLYGHEIPQVARIIAVADSWDAMTSDRPYRDAMTDEEALAELLGCSGKQFDPDVIRAFLSVIGRQDLFEQ
jgi:putative nucleotidyltransferase with HDIG domain